MANTTAMCRSFKQELLLGHHNFGVGVARAGTGADTIKAALYLATASLGVGTGSYNATGEVSGTGYSAGGVVVTNANAPALDGDVAHWTPSASVALSDVTLSDAFDAVLFYNASQGNKAISVHTFGAQMVTAGNFTLTMPTDDGASGLLRIE